MTLPIGPASPLIGFDHSRYGVRQNGQSGRVDCDTFTKPLHVLPVATLGPTDARQ